MSIEQANTAVVMTAIIYFDSRRQASSGENQRQLQPRSALRGEVLPLIPLGLEL